MVRRRVFETIGYFDDDPRLMASEDDEFFRRATRANFRLAMTGGALFASLRLHDPKKHEVTAGHAPMSSTAGPTTAKKPAKPGSIARSPVCWNNSDRWYQGVTSKRTRFGRTLKESRLKSRQETDPSSRSAAWSPSQPRLDLPPESGYQFARENCGETDSVIFYPRPDDPGRRG